MRELMMSMSSAMCGMVSKDFRLIFSGGSSADGAVCKHSSFAPQVVSDRRIIES